MARNPRQEVALRRKYAISRDETRIAFEQALADIAANPSAPVTEKALYEAAGRSRATLNRYPDIKERLADIRAGRASESPDKSKVDPKQEGGISDYGLCSRPVQHWHSGWRSCQWPFRILSAGIRRWCGFCGSIKSPYRLNWSLITQEKNDTCTQYETVSYWRCR